jgi:thiosulfate dehydrogenase [quinone] large subunit
MQAIVASWRRQSPAIRVLRAFLGVTFLYAGWHKASDPNFIGSGFADSVAAFASTSPISQLLDLALSAPELFAWAIIAAELAVGIFTLLGVASLTAALGGVLLSLTLWLASSWNVRPYFLAADPAYLALWSVYAIALWDGRARRRGSGGLRLDRRGLIRATLGAGVVAAIAVVGRRFAGAATPTATELTLDQLEVGGAATFTSSQGPAIAIRTGPDQVVAFSSTCTHEGCAVSYEKSRELLVCPCHGATFDPVRDAAPTAPATQPLPRINVSIDSTGRIVES